ncbi:MAG: Sulfite exporter TauE/SafE [bacterium ADurb.BinA186]|nr:MAG: Sulfite exporter TauE/SafE [bacterium ADurb.BinA186]
MNIMNLCIVIFVPFCASILTFFSGFGLGTILLPAFAILFPIEIAIAMTAIVHFLNNVFKLILLGTRADKLVIVRFGIPAVVASFAGAGLLTLLSHHQPIFSYKISDKLHHIFLLNLVVGILMIFFAVWELMPRPSSLRIGKKYLPLGGALSGFFGGLSGHQGAFRSAFLLKLSLSKEAFIATGVVVACGVDLVRLLVYGFGTRTSWAPSENMLSLALAIVSAWAGGWIGRKTLHLTTHKAIQLIVGYLLMVFGILIASGII